MCHHVDMAIDWEEVVEESNLETDHDGVDEGDEPAVDREPPALTPPADD